VTRVFPKTGWAWTIILWFSLSSGPPTLGQTPVSANGIVVDEQGNPVAEAELSQFWLGGTSEPGGFRNFGAVKSNGLGQFSLQIDRKQLPATVFVMDSARHRGAILRIADTSSANNLRVELLSLHQVQYRFEGAGLENLSQTRILLSPSTGSMFSQISGPTKGVLALPPGKFALTIASPDEGQKEIQFEVSDRDIVLDPITMSSGIAQYYGKQAPSLTTTVPINLTPFSFPTLRGKWTLIYFWAYWCAPCIEEGLPKLAAFYEERRALRNRFEIVGIHENGVPEMITVGDLTLKIENLQRDKWHRRPLPFSILLDRTGETVKA
jgi:thiol-disulfide isomerase/thioredoxin